MYQYKGGSQGYTSLSFKALKARQPELSLIAELCAYDLYFTEHIQYDLSIDHALKLCMNDLSWKDQAMEAVR